MVGERDTLILERFRNSEAPFSPFPLAGFAGIDSSLLGQARERVDDCVLEDNACSSDSVDVPNDCDVKVSCDESAEAVAS